MECQSRNLIRKRDDISIRRQCELLKVNRSTLYYTPKSPDEEARLLREEIMGRIDYWHTQMPAIGSRKIAALLHKDGFSVGRKYVRNCMIQMGIQAIYPKPNLSKCKFREGVVPYLLRNYVACFPNQVWSVDVTYIKMVRSHMYLTAIIDWYSRKIVGHYLSDTLDTDCVLIALESAIDKNGVPAIINSDQGPQFTSNDYKSRLKKHKIRQSMDGRSRWADNIMIERWFRSLKTELIYIEEFNSPKHLRRRIDEYVWQYNNLRPHEALDNDTPASVYNACFQAA